MHLRRGHILIVAELVFLFFGSQDVAWAQNVQTAPPAQWSPEFIQPAAGTRGPSDPLRVRLAGLPPNTLELLAMELDEIDVTSMVTVEGDVAVFTPPQPLAYGEHQLRLVEYGKDGSITERGQWSFELRKSAAFRDAKAQGEVTVTGRYRVLDHGIADPAPPLSQADGAAQFSGSTEDENLRTSAALAVIANSQSQNMPRQKGHIDLSSFLMAADSGSFGVKAGDHAIGPDSLVLQSFNRRGLSASATSPGKTAAITGFSMHTTTMTGAPNVLGVSDSDNRVNGVLATVQPVPGDAEALALMGTYVDGGTEGQADSGAGGGTGPSSGHAGSVIADSNLFQKRLRLRGEYAKSAFDFDGRSGDLAPLDGHAYTGFINYIPWHDMQVFERPLLWNMGLEKRLVSTYFRSPSSPNAISDRNMARVFSGVNWYGLDIQINAGKEYDNVDNNPLLPSTANRQRNAAITYSPTVNSAAQPNEPPPEPRWYGQPSLNASFTGLDRELLRDSGIEYNVQTHATYNSVFGANFQYPTWNWGLRQTWIRDRGYTVPDLTPFTRTTSTELTGNFRIADKLAVGMSVSRANADNVDTGIQTSGLDSRLNLAYPFTDKINGNLVYSAKHDWADDGSSDSVTSDITFGLNWAVNVPHGANPGVTVALDGSYHDVSDKNAASVPATYQVFMRLTLGWAPSY